MLSVPRQWYLVGLKGCPFTQKAEQYFHNHKLKFRKIVVETEKEAYKLREKEDLLCPDDFKTFPRIWSPMKEFLGGSKELAEMIRPGTVRFDVVSATQAERSYINHILINFSKIYFPDYTMVADSQHPDVELSLLEPEALVGNLVDKHKVSNEQAEEFLSMSVTLMTRSLPRIIYLNKATFYLRIPKVAHFVGNLLGYHLYVILHEFHHALGFVHHYNSSYKHRQGTESRILTQQTHRRFTKGTTLMTLDRLLPFFAEPDHVENRLCRLLENLSSKTNSTMSTSTREDDTVVMTDLHENYNQWFENGSNTSVPTIFQEQDLVVETRPTKENKNKNNKKKSTRPARSTSARYLSGGASSVVSSYDGSTSTKSSSSSSSSSDETSSDVSSVVSDIIDDRFDASATNLAAGESTVYYESEMNGRQSPSEFLGLTAVTTLDRLKRNHELDL